MDAAHFDQLILRLTRARNRRSLLSLLAAMGLTGLLARDVAAACRKNGRRCTTGLACCSGRCVRKRGTNTRFCRQAPDQGTCTTEADACVAVAAACDSGGIGNCACWVTHQGYSVCANNFFDECVACESHADCEQRAGGQVGDRCVRCRNCSATSDWGCVRKCPDPAWPRAG